MTLDQTRTKLEIAQRARLINYAAADIREFEVFDTRARLYDIASLAEKLGVPLQGDRDAGELCGGAFKGAKYRFDLQFLTWDFS